MSNQARNFLGVVLAGMSWCAHATSPQMAADPVLGTPPSNEQRVVSGASIGIGGGISCGVLGVSRPTITTIVPDHAGNQTKTPMMGNAGVISRRLRTDFYRSSVGGLFSAQLGYNWRLGAWLLGANITGAINTSKTKAEIMNVIIKNSQNANLYNASLVKKIANRGYLSFSGRVGVPIMERVTPFAIVGIAFERWSIKDMPKPNRVSSDYIGSGYSKFVPCLETGLGVDVALSRKLSLEVTSVAHLGKTVTLGSGKLTKTDIKVKPVTSNTMLSLKYHF